MNNLDFLEQNKDITFFSSFRTKAVSKYFFQINTLEDIEKLKEILLYSQKNNVKYEIIWAWTNMLFAFDEYDGIIIRNALKAEELNIFDNKTEVFSGDNVITTTRKLIEKWYTKFAPFLWLPGTFGWAIAWNAWCFWLEIKDILLSAKLLDLETLEIIEVDNNFFEFDYRYSCLKNTSKYFIISAILDINWQSDLENIEETLKVRKQTQPYWATCGSYFKNPTWEAAWRLIQEVWLKWHIIGWAKISELHGNFFINFNNWTYKDILQLAELAKQKVKDKFWIELVEEVKIIK